ncbi:hypothetical protein Ciccas_004682 [Cichlidogyrus casuarinus]|uniref:RING-type domain-containing protein n=1 Tax=Cichlidogyrus casuarinus TaxID=1844966 RepID=A0ABD2QAU1_9PLAT
MSISELNGYLMCGLCGGYLIESTVLSNCMHAFCRSCIVKYLCDNKLCPLCQSFVDETRPGNPLKYDDALQKIVFKLVPGLLSKEIKNMEKFESQQLESKQFKKPMHIRETQFKLTPTAFATRSLSKFSPVEVTPDPYSRRIIVDSLEKISLALSNMKDNIYLLCPADMKISTLQHFILSKYQVTGGRHEVEIYLNSEFLESHFNLRDVIFLYRYPIRSHPLQLHFNFVDLRSSWWGNPLSGVEENPNFY